MSKILCPDGVEREVEEVFDVEYENYPRVILNALLAGRKSKRKKDSKRSHASE